MYIVLGHLALFYLILQGNIENLLISLLMTYVILQVGISLTYHRAISHNSIKLPKWLEIVGSLIGGLSLQGSPLSWAVIHRTHHKHTSTEHDPHSPKYLGSTYIHLFGYAFSSSIGKYAGSLLRTWHVPFHRYYYMIYASILILSLFIFPFELAIALFYAPIALSFQFENFVNTWLHNWNKDEPINNHWVQLFVLGEAYHKNHHDYPGHFRFGTYDIIGFLGEKFLKK
jgi:stearoyl-CoA desaturase (delta-9 desaturase)